MEPVGEFELKGIRRPLATTKGRCRVAGGRTAWKCGARGIAFTVMTSTQEEKAFLRVAVAAIPRVAELILGFAPDDRAGALERAERCFLAVALDHGCTEITAQSRVSAVHDKGFADALHP